VSFLVGLVSDTHGLLRPELLAALRGVDLLLHAGDVGSHEVLLALEALAPLRAVRGNTDTVPLAIELPGSALVEGGGRSFYLLHELHRLDLDPAAAGVEAVVFGHSHRAEAYEEGAVLYVNPGSAGPRRFGLAPTVARIRVPDRGRLAVRDVEIVELLA
jgi:uncharacterized protein